MRTILSAAAALFVILIMGASVFPAEANDDRELNRLREEIEAMRKAYEARIGELERRVRELEGKRRQDHALTTEEDEQAPAAAADVEGKDSSLARALEKRDVTRGLTLSGYLRTGYGVDGEGNTMEPFQAPNSQSKFRLGNEGETYAETAFGYSFPELDLPDDKDFYIAFRPSYVVPDARFDKNSEFSMREAYALARGVWVGNPTAAFWLGQRYYDRYDIHMSDFYYLDMSGFGGGVEDIRLGSFGKLSLAWFGGSIDALESNGATVADTVDSKNSLDIRIYAFDVPGGRGMLWLDLAHAEDSESPNGVNVNVDGGSGAAFAVGHEAPDFFGGFSRAMVQYGFGAAANFRSTESDFSFLDPAPAPAAPLPVDLADAWHLRFVADLVVEPTEKLSLQAAFVYDEFDSGAEVDPQRRWVSFGVRPVYAMGDYFSLALEGGVDHTDGDGQPSGELYKLTIAPQITPGKGYFKRPALRLFATYAFWSDEFEGFVAPGNHGSDTEGINFGVQAEAWW